MKITKFLLLNLIAILVLTTLITAFTTIQISTIGAAPIVPDTAYEQGEAGGETQCDIDYMMLHALRDDTIPAGENPFPVQSQDWHDFNDGWEDGYHNLYDYWLENRFAPNGFTTEYAYFDWIVTGNGATETLAETACYNNMVYEAHTKLANFIANDLDDETQIAFPVEVSGEWGDPNSCGWAPGSSPQNSYNLLTGGWTSQRPGRTWIHWSQSNQFQFFIHVNGETEEESAEQFADRMDVLAFDISNQAAWGSALVFEFEVVNLTPSFDDEETDYLIEIVLEITYDGSGTFHDPRINPWFYEYHKDNYKEHDSQMPHGEFDYSYDLGVNADSIEDLDALEGSEDRIGIIVEDGEPAAPTTGYGWEIWEGE